MTSHNRTFSFAGILAACLSWCASLASACSYGVGALRARVVDAVYVAFPARPHHLHFVRVPKPQPFAALRVRAAQFASRREARTSRLARVSGGGAVGIGLALAV